MLQHATSCNFTETIWLSASNIVQTRATLAAYLAVGTCCSCGWKAMQVTGPRCPRKALSSLNSAKCCLKLKRESTIIFNHFSDLLWCPPPKTNFQALFFRGHVSFWASIFSSFFGEIKCNWHHLKTRCQDLRCGLHCWRRYHIHGNQA